MKISCNSDATEAEPATIIEATETISLHWSVDCSKNNLDTNDMATNLLHEGLAIRVFCALVTKFSGQERETRLAVPFHGLNGSAIEGAIILSRTFHSGNPMLEAGKQLACLIRRCQ